MKTLVIHPDDITTAFLDQVYEGKDWTIINDVYTPKKYIKEQIKIHDRIVMMGHGTPWGLIGGNRLFIDASLVYLLRDKEVVAMWCNADQFVEKYDLKGFYTGMIISELQEAVYCKVESNHKEILQSNILFTDALTKSIDSGDMLGNMIKEYVGESPTIKYNAERLYTR